MSNEILVIFFSYFWLLGAGVNILNLIYFYYKLKSNTEVKDNEAIKSVILPFTLIFIVAFMVIGALQLIGGYNNPFFFLSRDINVVLVLSWLTMVCQYIGLFYWSNYKDGISKLMLIRTTKMKGNPTIIKALFNGIMIISVIILIFGIIFNVYERIDSQFTLLLNSM